jgi:hypothetical protein
MEGNELEDYEIDQPQQENMDDVDNSSVEEDDVNPSYEEHK